jgi:hypothetical protein
VAGTAYAIYKRTAGDFVLASFMLLYYLMIGSAQVRFARYVIPILPILAIFAARVSVEATRRLMSPKSGLGHPRFSLSRQAGYGEICLLVLVVANAAYCSWTLDKTFAQIDTRDKAAIWIRSHMPTGATIAFPTIPWFYTPPLGPSIALPIPAMDRYAAMQDEKTYHLTTSESEWDSAFLQRESPSHVVTSEFEYHDRLRLGDPSFRAYSAILNHDYRVEQRFPDMLRKSMGFLWAPELPHDMSYASPEITIYSRKVKR